ncbi:phosphomannomutase [Thiomicrorhabdus sp. 6S2-11]|uniref:Phosphomannomutase n=1 Tax=Thiomicrorhabdus marina TaxID=2818442 RepID=A0ABS3Q1X0_9GAMM|nr:phosphomannomutase [Thiomicrorhabdus marina]
MTQTVKEIIQQSGIGFGTSGARGLVTDFTDQACAAFTLSFIAAMQHDFSFKRLAVAMDNRPSSPQIAAAICGAAKAMQIDVVFYGVIPTPALALQAMIDQEPSIMVTGSHIPFDRNGIKFYRPDGEITKADEAAIIACDLPMLAIEPELPDVNSVATQTYTNRYADYFGKQALSGLKIGIYEHSSAGRDLYSALLTQMGVEVTSLGRSNEFVPIDTEAVADADREKARAWSKQYGFDAIFSTDGDGDRPLIADEKGEWLRGDIVGLLTSKFLGIEALAVPVSCNTAIEKSAEFNLVSRTRIGSPYVIEAFMELSDNYASFAGFEANGGYLLGSDLTLNDQVLKALPTRDALLPVIVLLSHVVQQKQSLSSFVSALPQRFTASDRIQGVPTQTSQTLIAEGAENPERLLAKLDVQNRQVSTVNQVDGLRLTLSDNSVIHLRPSGNAPELRCYAEAEDQLEAVALVNQCLNKIRTLV